MSADRSVPSARCRRARVIRFTRWPRVIVIGVLAAFGAAAPGTAQTRVEVDPSENARFRFGSLAFTPALVFSSGHDTNVYREPTGFSAYETFAVPQGEAWWSQPGFRVRGYGAMEFVYFGGQAGGSNAQAGARIDRTNAEITPFFGFNRRRTNAAVTGLETGYKSLRIERAWTTGSTFNLSPRADLLVGLGLTQTRWDADAIYAGSDLREKLNRDTRAVSTGIGYALTPLTSVSGTVEFIQDRFTFSPVRDGDTYRVSGAFSFAKPAMIAGVASLGYQKFEAGQSGAADFNGLITSANLSYGSPDGTLLRLTASRETQYSFDTSLAYFVLTSINPSVARAIGTRWEAVGFFAYHQLDYSQAQTVAAMGRRDVVVEFGATAAYRATPWAKIGMGLEKGTKDGPGGFRSLRVMTFLTYGSGTYQRMDRPTPFDR